MISGCVNGMQVQVHGMDGGVRLLFGLGIGAEGKPLAVTLDVPGEVDERVLSDALWARGRGLLDGLGEMVEEYRGLAEELGERLYGICVDDLRWLLVGGGVVLVEGEAPDDWRDEAPWNGGRAPLLVSHGGLEGDVQAEWGSWDRQCPVCEKGRVEVHRREGGALSPWARCRWCWQELRWRDYEWMLQGDEVGCGPPALTLSWGLRWD